ncbi:glycosyltransferase family 4 protein [Chromohalobacter sp. 48-RD10]|uniref:glycosyltransferase family 4 protein n=1 Tax=Chromohalobacter sp. 48-RD10 TaxID=2994063 RepID=UPI002469ABFA|nr:glycosyltransferase family 4 protein [Chromohalobacter sp. 48-RD10]
MSTVVFTSNTSWFLYNFRRKTIRGFVDAGHRVVCLSPHDDYSRRLGDELGAEFFSIPLDGKGVGIWKELKSLFFIFRAIRRLSPDIVFNSTIKMNVYIGITCKTLGIPFANNVSGLGTAFIHDSLLFKLVRRIYGRINQKAVRVFFENEDDREVFEAYKLLGNTPVTVLPGSGVDLQRFSASPLPGTSPFTFIMIARLLGDKGVREYAEACRQLKAEGRDVRCLLVGPMGVSNRTAIAEDEVRQWQAEGIVEYLGATDDVRPLIMQAHVLVLPSYREGMPRTVLEAAAMGRPAIVTDVPGCRHAIEPGVTGWLCEVRSADSLVDQMRRVMTMGASELQNAGDAARERMEERFSEDVVVRAYLDCL